MINFARATIMDLFYGFNLFYILKIDRIPTPRKDNMTSGLMSPANGIDKKRGPVVAPFMQSDQYISP
jgi:hypothetical protein